MTVDRKKDAQPSTNDPASSGSKPDAPMREGTLKEELLERTRELQRANEALREVSFRLSQANERLRIAMECGKSVGWDRDVKSGRDVLFGDLQGIFGMPLQTYIGRVEDFHHRVHLEDRARVMKAVDDAMESHMPYEAEFRVVLPDGAARWLSAKGKFYYSSNGKPERMVGMAVDVTERKLMEVALRDSEERLRLAVQAGKMYAIDWDVETDLVVRSDEAIHVHGLSGDSTRLTHRQMLARVHPEDRTKFTKSVADLTPQKPTCQASFRVSRPDGSLLWLERSGRAFFDKQGKMVRMIGVVADITERKLAEEALRKSDERFRLAATTGKMFAYEWNAATDAIERSGESARILQIDEATPFTGAQAISKVHPEDRENLKAAVARLSPEKPYLLTRYRMIRPDGTVFWVERNSQAYFDDQGRILRVIGMVMDITERKQAEDKLQEYERTVEGLDEMIAVIDRDYRYRIANNKFIKMKNLTKEQVIGRFASEVLDKRAFDAVIKGKVDESFQGKTVRYEMKYTYPELGERDMLVSYFPIEGATGVDRLACIVQDITDRKLAEEALSTVSQKLIEAQEQERSRIARELHDDINQRLALLAVTLDRLKHALPNSAVELGRRIGEASQIVADLSEDVQNLSHQLHSPKLELLGLASAAASFCRELSDQRGVEIDFHADDIPKQLTPEISLPLFRVLQEALQNAVKHSGSTRVEVLLKHEGSEIELAVRDEGAGFELEEAIKGRGLGLTSMIERLKVVRGRLSIDSNPQCGTTLRARVPLVPGAKSASAANH